MAQSKILAQIRENAARRPDRIAVALGDTKYSFRELLEESGRIAAAIDSRYVRQPIVVLANREAETILMFIAVLISGNYYVPIDPEMPVGKMKRIMDEVEPVCVFENPQEERTRRFLSVFER